MNKTKLTFLSCLIKNAGIQVTEKSLIEESEKHLNFPDVHSITQILNNFAINSSAYSINYEELSLIPCPYITVLLNEFSTVTNKTPKYVTITNSSLRNHHLKIESFEKEFKNIVIIVEKINCSKEDNYKSKRRLELGNKIRYPFVLTGFILVFFTFLFFHRTFTGYSSPIYFILISLKSLGTIICILLLKHQLDKDDSVIKKICKNSNCNRILASKAARVSEEVSWSEIGFFYFAGTLLTLLVNFNNVWSFKILAFINLISLPYTVFSIFYQKFIAKEWCVLCCVIQGLLWLEFFLYRPFLIAHFPTLEVGILVDFCVCMVIPILIWICLKPFLVKAQLADPLHRQLLKFRYNAQSFHASLKSNAKVALLNDEQSMIIGNIKAKKTITLIANPFCNSCGETHKALEKWIANRKDIKLQLIFLSSNILSMEPKEKIATHLLSLNMQTPEIISKAINEWYDLKDYEKWSKAYPVRQNPDIKRILEVQREWCRNAFVEFTPIVFINGRKLSEIYYPEDLKYFF